MLTPQDFIVSGLPVHGFLLIPYLNYPDEEAIWHLIQWQHVLNHRFNYLCHMFEGDMEAMFFNVIDELAFFKQDFKDVYHSIIEI